MEVSPTCSFSEGHKRTRAPTVALGRDPGLVGLLDKVGPVLLLAKVNGVVLCAELEVSALHVVGPTRRTQCPSAAEAQQNERRGERVYSRAGPAHQRVLPATTALENVKVDAPVGGAGLSRRVGCLGRLEDAHLSLVQLRCRRRRRMKVSAEVSY